MDSPKLYDVQLTYRIYGTAIDIVRDRIGFRTLKTKGKEILLNGKAVFLRGVCLHEKIEEHGKAVTKEKIHRAFLLDREMNYNSLSLAHYPHTEWVSRLADKEGFLLWEEIPVYWWIDFVNHNTLENAKNQLTELITRAYNMVCRE